MSGTPSSSSGRVTCAWCDETATTDIEVEPAAYKTATQLDQATGRPITAQVVSRFAIKVPVCEVHAGIKDAQPSQRPSCRAKAKGVDQLTIFHVPGVGPGNAIHGP